MPTQPPPPPLPRSAPEKLPRLGDTWRALYPFTSRFMRVPGGQYHYVDEGAGVPLVFVHGNPTWSFHWRRLIAHLRDRYRCVAMDHIGCGQSDRPGGWTYRFTDHVENLSRLLEELDLRQVTLAGHDWGGAISLAAALRSDDRVTRLVLFNTGAWPPATIPGRIAACRVPALGRLAVQGGNLFLLGALRMAFAGPCPLTAAERAGYLAPYRSWQQREAIYRFIQDIPRSPRHPTHHALAELCSRLADLAHRPVLLVWGMRDWCFTPDCLQRFLDIFPHAAVRKISHAGHWVVEEAFDEVAGALDAFLASCLRLERPGAGGHGSADAE